MFLYNFILAALFCFLESFAEEMTMKENLTNLSDNVLNLGVFSRRGLSKKTF